MENAEERKKMKKIEKEEQLKKKLEQTMEEKMAADSMPQNRLFSSSEEASVPSLSIMRSVLFYQNF